MKDDPDTFTLKISNLVHPSCACNSDDDSHKIGVLVSKIMSLMEKESEELDLCAVNGIMAMCVAATILQRIVQDPEAISDAIKTIAGGILEDNHARHIHH